MITGSLPRQPLWCQVLTLVLVSAILAVPLFLVAALLLVGFLGVAAVLQGGKREVAEMWICLPPALLSIGLAAYGVYHWYRAFRLTIIQFNYTKRMFEYRIREHQFLFHRELSDCVEIRKHYSKGRLKSYTIRFRGGDWVLLLAHTENGAALVEQLEADLAEGEGDT
jgi:succinate dehydrogenase/fumarate reductase cytochrome b subunit